MDMGKTGGMMSKMQSIKIPKRKADKGMSPVADSGSDSYPYGLRVTLNEDQIKKLGYEVFDHDVETPMYVMAKGVIVAKDSPERAGKKSDRSMTIQITELCLEKCKTSTGEKSKEDEAAEFGF